MKAGYVECVKTSRSEWNARLQLKRYDIEHKTVGRGNTSSGRVNLPLSWVGKLK